VFYENKTRRIRLARARVRSRETRKTVGYRHRGMSHADVRNVDNMYYLIYILNGRRPAKRNRDSGDVTHEILLVESAVGRYSDEVYTFAYLKFRTVVFRSASFSYLAFEIVGGQVCILSY